LEIPSQELESMKKVVIVLSDTAFELAEKDAQSAGGDVSALCATVLTDYFFKRAIAHAQTTNRIAGGAPPIERTSATPTNFATAAASVGQFRKLSELDVRREFPNYPEKSLIYAERIVRELRELPIEIKWKLRPNRRGIVFEPNFVVIEYLLSRHNRSGVALSLGASVSRYSNPPHGFKRGRTDSYSWIRIEDDAVLQEAIPLVRETFQLRYGSNGPDPVPPAPREPQGPRRNRRWNDESD
jgi:hypothetical protein